MKILVISLAGIGDTLFATPLIHELHLNFPTALIDVVVNWPGSKDILTGNPYVNQVFQKNLIEAGFISSIRFLLGLRRQAYDVSLNPMPQSRVEYRVAARLIGARMRVSHDYPHFRALTPFLVSRTVSLDYSKHCVENNLAFLDLLGAQPKLPQHKYELFIRPDEVRWAEQWVIQHRLQSYKLLGIHVGSGGTKNLGLRRWPLDHYAALINKLISRHNNLTILLVGGQQEFEAQQHLLCIARSDRVFAPKTENIRKTAALIKQCSIFLSVDTALMHLAAAVGTPQQIVIETPTWNKTIEPYLSNFVLVKNPRVSGNNLKYYRYDGRGIRGGKSFIVACMRAVTVDSVYQEIVRFL